MPSNQDAENFGMAYYTASYPKMLPMKFTRKYFALLPFEPPTEEEKPSTKQSNTSDFPQLDWLLDEISAITLDGPNISQASPVPLKPKKRKANTIWWPGDWKCSRCGNHNFSYRDLCKRCKFRKGAVVIDGATAHTPQVVWQPPTPVSTNEARPTTTSFVYFPFGHPQFAASNQATHMDAAPRSPQNNDGNCSSTESEPSFENNPALDSSFD
ncbi:hypothetical protein Ae201684_009179 [Aphanomyces euteiches]|uniref:RanBP2-type domain-containing protein n=1 Tax=Aphanomyces euteiches TaxID=100861 RepID=A0A6G0X2J7_9STRA|nr:hypothetical protein Ae201684_009179 [Aphanomyces euteiches]